MSLSLFLSAALSRVSEMCSLSHGLVCLPCSPNVLPHCHFQLWILKARVTRDPETIQELSNLPSSGCLRQYPPRFGLKLVELFEDLIQDKKGLPPLPEVVPPAERMLESMFFEDLWPEAAIQDVCHYLRGGKLLSIPHSFRDVLPGRL